MISFRYSIRWKLGPGLKEKKSWKLLYTHM